MKVVINYCDMCGGIGEAKRAQDELKRYMDIDATLVDVSRGKFEVVVSGTVIFSKEKMGRFPEPKELITLLRKGKA